jgi:S-DNA-T family DNA segregation ATPase FtsK/SpoIIIE
VGRQQSQAAGAPRVRHPVRDESRVLDEIAAIISLTAAVFTFLSFFAYHSGTGLKFAGRVGFGLADTAVQTLGLAAYLAPLFLLLVAFALFRQASSELSIARGAGCSVIVVCAAVLLALAAPPPSERSITMAGGWMGGFLAAVLLQALGKMGALLIVGALLLLSFIFVTRISLGRLLAATGRGVRRGFVTLREVVRRPEREAPVLLRATVKNVKNVKKEVPPEARSEAPIIIRTDDREKKPAPGAKQRLSRIRQEELQFDPGGRYQIPSLDFLDPPNHADVQIDEEALHKSSRILEAKLADFGIVGKVVEVRPGPVITTFDIEPAPGIKVNRIVSLADDLAMALRVPGVRILAPVPGKAVVGIEVANPRREDVLLRELVEAEDFAQSSSSLVVALGKDTAGSTVIGDLARMPHLLIAGATGSGKSVAINAMIMSILYKAAPRDVRFVMIDLKMLELSVYEDIPHQLVPVVTDPKQAVAVLNNIVEQMDERYRLMKGRGVRNIDGYNRLVEEELEGLDSRVIELKELADGTMIGEERDADDDEELDVEAAAALPPRPERLPKIVVIIDELADLMMTMGRKVEEPITRLAQKARAAGIHLMLATQRPSVDVITGLIKANFPARISFQTTARVDSRTILDQIGAERLLGRGDMLYMPPGSARIQRLHGPLVTEAEIHKVVDFIKRQATPQYVLSLLECPDEEGDEEGFDEDLSDELYDQAVQLVTDSGQASISWVQRRLRVGYNRAARMIERMEREGVISTSENGRPREVLAQRIDAD